MSLAIFIRRAFRLLLVLFALTGSCQLQAQTDTSWRKEASERFKAIYDRGEYRVRGINVRWLPDGSGYQVRGTTFDVKTGEKKEAERQALPARNLDVNRRGRDLLLRDPDTNKLTLLVKGAEDRMISYRDISLSADEKYVSFVEVDRTEIRKRSVLVPGDPSYPGVTERQFARVGGRIDALRVGIVSTSDGEVTWVPIEIPEEGIYLGKVEWVGDSQELLVETVSRFRDRRTFWLATPDGRMTRITGEENEAWAIGSHQINLGAHWIHDHTAFIYISEKDGWRHAWLCSRDGKTDTLLTPGEFDLIDRAHVDEQGGWYYFYASPDNATQKFLYRVPLDGSGKKQRVTPGNQEGTHDYQISPNAKWAIHTRSTINTPPVVDLVELPNHRVVRVLEGNAAMAAKMKRRFPHPVEFVQIDIGEGVVMDASITKPKDFDPTKKYPLFVYVYGEPYLQTVLDRWGAAQVDFHRVVADAGYVVVSIDNRGTAAPKGAAWRRSVFGSLGPLSTEDQAAAIKKLAAMKSYVDLERVGIWGWSGGGSNTLNAMFRKPDVYHVGIAVVPKPQPHLYNAWFQEIYMRTREVNADGYKRSAPINFAEGLKGDLLIVTGSGETNTHIQIIEGLVDRLIELGKPFDYMVYPNRDHGLREGPGSVVHVRMLILRYLIEHLPRGPRS